jgi:rhodanese-related sulfurtransferase
MQYKDDVSCKECWQSLSEHEKSALVDVRTTREWEVIGKPDLSSLGKSVIFAEWQKFPDMVINEAFALDVDAQLKSAGITHSDPVYFLCRSGVRSQGAANALAALGYTNTFNIISGFEGGPDANGERGKVAGWQFDQLPWTK